MWPYICFVHVFSVFWIGAVLDFLLTIILDDTLALWGQNANLTRKWSFCLFGQVLRYFDYVFTGVFTFEMLIKVK